MGSGHGRFKALPNKEGEAREAGGRFVEMRGGCVEKGD